MLTASGPENHPLPPRLLLGFPDLEFERRFVDYYTSFYYRFAQASLALGLLLVLGDFLVDWFAYPGISANTTRLTLCAPLLLLGLAYSLHSHARKYWEPVMSAFVVTTAAALFWILLAIDTQGGQGLHSWVGILNFAILQLYCFVILGTRFRHSLVSGLLIYAGFEYAILWDTQGASRNFAYWTYHTTTMVVIAGMLGWWREFMLRKNFATEAMLLRASTRHDTERSLLRATLEASDSGILVVNTAGQVTSYNRRFAEMWRIPEAVLATHSDAEMLNFVLAQLQDPQQFVRTVQEYYQQPQAKSQDRLLFTDGRVFERSSYPQKLHDTIVGRVWSFLDVTDQLQAQERVTQLTQSLSTALDNSERQRGQLQALLGAIPEMVWMKDPAGAFLSCNAAFEQLIGAAASELIGKTDHDFSPRHIAEAFDANDRAATASQIPVVYEEWVDHQTEGRMVLLETTKVAVRDVQGELIGVLGVARDITASRALLTDLEQAKEEAQRSNRAKSLFLANMSHEIRTPMNAIMGMADLALNTKLDARQRNYLGKIRLASNGLMHIINDILDFSKIEAEKMQIEHIPFELDDVLEQLSGLMALRAESQGIEFVYQLDTSIPPVLVGDALRLGQVLTNLVSNALKFSSGGAVILRVAASALDATHSSLQFSVSDQGIGISTELSAQMFQPFIQADVSTTRRFGGTGLGLAICRHLVALFGGRIWVDSEVGVGSTFHFTARLAHGEAMPQPGLGQERDAAVLLVVHQPATRLALQQMLEQQGLRTVTANSAAAASTLLRHPDAPGYVACLVDGDLPDMDGLYCMQELRAVCTQRAKVPPPMLGLTSHTRLETMQTVQQPAGSWLAKPVSPRLLYDALAHCMGLPGRLRQRCALRPDSALNWARFRGLDIVLAEDMDINQEVMRELLSALGLAVRIASNGVEALDAVRQQVPDLILMDCHMPVMDGYIATQQLRSNPVYDKVVVIALTANAMAEDRQRCLACGMNGYVTKPVHMDELYAQMDLCLPATPTAAGEPEHDAPLAPVLPQEQTLATLDGIDAALGLEQVGGRVELFIKLLKKFRDNLGSSFEPQFAAALAAGDWPTAKRLVHSLKGLGTTLGATDLAVHALALERALPGQVSAEIALRLQDVARELGRVCAALAVLNTPVQQGEQPRRLQPLSPTDLEQLQALVLLLENKDVEALEYVQTLDSTLSGSVHHAAWKHIAEATDRYAFGVAVQALQTLLERLRAEA